MPESDDGLRRLREVLRVHVPQAQARVEAAHEERRDEGNELHTVVIP